MIYFIGDIHGNFKTFKKIVSNIPKDATIIQVGDFGFWPHLKEEWEAVGIDRPVYFIDGNHDHQPSFSKVEEEIELWPNAIFIPRGTIKEIDNFKILFMGGAGSVDYKWRRKGIDYFPLLEEINQFDIDKVPTDAKIDLIVSHTPPRDCIDKCFDPAILETFFNISRNWTDKGSILLENLRKKLGNPPLICGHMHRAIKWNGIRILNINEVFKFPDDL